MGGEVVAACVLLADGIVFPNDLAGGGLDGVEEDLLMRKHAGAEIGDAVIDQQTRAHRPARDHAAACQDALVVRSGAKLPYKAAGPGIKAVSIAVIGTDVDFSRRDGRRQTHRAVGEERPLILAGGEITADHATIHGGAKIDLPRADGDMKHIIKADAVQRHMILKDPAIFTRPGHLRRRIQKSMRIAAAGGCLRWSHRHERHRAGRSASRHWRLKEQ